MAHKWKKIKNIAIVGTISFIVLGLIVVGGMTYNQQKQMAIISKQAKSMNGNGGSGTTWNDGTLEGQFWGYLTEKGLPDIQKASIMGNIEAESGFRIDMIEAGNGIGYGLCQWSFGRRTQLEQYARSTGKTLASLPTQAEFFWMEFSPIAEREGYASFQWIHPRYTYEGFMSATTIKEATTIFCHGWERCKEDEGTSHLLSRRIPMAETYYQKYKGTSGGVSGGIGGSEGILATAKNQLGNIGGEPFWSWYGFNSRVEWCACFVSWCANENGLIDSGKILKFAKCTTGVNWFREKGQWLDGGKTPSTGMIIFFDWGGDGSSDHVGIVENVNNGYVNTVEGNSGDMCRTMSYPIGSGKILGYGTY